jgi:hypothetical protein
MKNKKQKIPWDETLVIGVMVASAIGILIILASYLSATGNAIITAPTHISAVSVLNQAITVHGEAPKAAKCEVECLKVERSCMLSRAGDQIVGCNDKIKGAYSCLCVPIN